MNDERRDDEIDSEEAEKYKGSDLFAKWYQQVFLPNGGRIHSNNPHMLWDELGGEFFEWLDNMKAKRQEEKEKSSKRTFEYWYEHVYQGDRPTDGDPKDDDEIYGAYEAWDEITHFWDDMSDEERSGWNDLIENSSQ